MSIHRILFVTFVQTTWEGYSAGKYQRAKEVDIRLDRYGNTLQMVLFRTVMHAYGLDPYAQ